MMKKKHYGKWYYPAIISVYILFAALVTAGGAVVTVNCHNALYSDKMVLIDFSKTESGFVLTVMDKQYLL